MSILKPPERHIRMAVVAGLLTALALSPVACRKNAPIGARPAGLELARSSFAAGDCQGAAVLMEDFLARQGIGSATADGLMSLVLCYLSGPETLRDRDRALELLRHMEAEGGDAGWQRQAALLLELVKQASTAENSLERRNRRVRELEREIEGLKQIDTRPGRPPR